MDVNVGKVSVDDDLAWEEPDVLVSRHAAVGAANPKMLGATAAAPDRPWRPCQSKFDRLTLAQRSRSIR